MYLGILITLSLMPADDVPDVSLFEGFDKFVHICLYLGFAWLLCWSLHVEKKPFVYYLILLLSFTWGLLMEIFQYLMHLGRAFEWFDIISNTSGALIGIIIYRLMIRQKDHTNYYK
jgi:glycopeptide antibiotics resistance protein